MQAETVLQNDKPRAAKATVRVKAANPPVIEPAKTAPHPVYGAVASMGGFSLEQQSLPVLNHWHGIAVEGALSFGELELTKSQEEMFDLYDNAAWDIHIAAEKVAARNSREVWHKVDLLARQSRYLGNNDCNVNATTMTAIAAELERYTVPRPPSLPDQPLGGSRGIDVTRRSIRNAKTGACPTTTERLIADFRAAKRTWRKAEKDLQALIDRHPDLKDHLPVVLLYTKTSGEDVFAGSILEAERLLHPSYDKIKPDYPILRQAFAERLGPARDKHWETRKRVGVAKAERDKFAAVFNLSKAFQALCRHKPKSIQEIAMMAGVIRRDVVTVVGALTETEVTSLYADRGEIPSFKDWEAARSSAVTHFAAFLSTLSKAG